MKSKDRFLAAAVSAVLLTLAVSVYGQLQILHTGFSVGRDHNQNPFGYGPGIYGSSDDSRSRGHEVHPRINSDQGNKAASKRLARRSG